MLVQRADAVGAAIRSPGGSHFGQLLAAHGLAALLLQVAGGNLVRREPLRSLIKPQLNLNGTLALVDDALAAAVELHQLRNVKRDAVEVDALGGPEPFRRGVVGRRAEVGRQPLERGRESGAVPARNHPEGAAIQDKVAGGLGHDEVAGGARVGPRHPALALDVELLVPLPSPLQRVGAQVQGGSDRGEQGDCPGHGRDAQRCFLEGSDAVPKEVTRLRSARSCRDGC